MSTASDPAEAWNDYWRGQRGGCLPNASSTLDALFREQWRRVAVRFGPSARVVDLATGNGLVLTWLRELRPDLDLVGVDLARTLPPPPPGIIVHGGVAMEQLPFADASFDAAVSQFGFEYGDLARCAAEAARVLRASGTLALVTHHAAGPIVAQNRKRAAELSWALDEARLVEGARLSHAAAERRAVEAGPGLAAARFGGGSAGWQLAEAIARVVRGAPAGPDRAASAMLDQLERMARGELQRIAALEQASTAVGAAGRLDAIVAAYGFEPISHVPLIHAADGLTVADFRSYRRS